MRTSTAPLWLPALHSNIADKQFIGWLAVGRRFTGSMQLAGFAETLPAINSLQTVSRLERQHLPRILRGKSTDLIQLPELVLGECEFDRREIAQKLSTDSLCAERGSGRCCRWYLHRRVCSRSGRSSESLLFSYNFPNSVLSCH